MIGHPNPTSNEIEGRDSGINAFDDANIARQNAIKQIELRRHFRIQAAMTAVGAMILILIWALTEYHNAGGWPTHGFSQSSGIHDVWNFWIVYPIGGLVLIFSG